MQQVRHAAVRQVRRDDAARRTTARRSCEAGLVEQGGTTSVRETLTPKHREIGPMPPDAAAAAAGAERRGGRREDSKRRAR